MDKTLLFKSRLGEGDVEIPGIGTVRVRALNRLEAMRVQAAEGPEATERCILMLGMVDPVLTEGEVQQWQRASVAGEIEAVSTKIAQLSGMLPGADKEAYKSFPGGPGDGVRVLPSAEAGDDRSPTSGGDE